MIPADKHALFRIIGPGLLLAGAAIGVSHLVQATRAGADYGFALWWVILLACVTKYPFMEFGARYAAATGQTLVTGYRNLGDWPFRAFVFVTVGTMFIIQAAVTVVTAGLAEQVFGLGWSPLVWSGVILATCVVLLLVGRYRGLDLTMKVIISLLSLGTLVAVVLALSAGSVPEVVDTPTPSYLTAAGLAFLIALIGWMPIPLDAAVWHTIWNRDQYRQEEIRFGLNEVLLDFNVGYFVAAGLGFLFFLLGALVMFPSGQSFSENSVEFSGQLAALYGQTLGDWSRSLVSVAALTAMVSTTLAVTDAYPRVITHLMAARRNTGDDTGWDKASRAYNISLVIIPVVSVSVLYFAPDSFTHLVDFAAGLSFVSAPLLAVFNYRLVTGSDVRADAHPGPIYRIFAMICLVLLCLFAAVYLLWRVGLF